MAFYTKTFKNLQGFVQKRPIPAFLILFALLVGLMFLNKAITTPKAQEEKTAVVPKVVQTFRIGDQGIATLEAKISKVGTYTVYAQVPGIVQKVYVQEGSYLGDAKPGLYISTNYAGANTATVSRQIAAKQLENAQKTFDIQQGIIANSRDLATKNEQNADALRNITEQSLSNTRDLISLNESLVKSINTNIDTLISSGQPDTSSAVIALRSQKAQIESGLLQLRSNLRQSEYQAGDSNIPADLARITKDTTLKQLDLQQQGLQIGKDVAALQLRLAQIQESLFYPTSQCGGMIEKVFVKEHDIVAAGAPLFTLTPKKQEVKGAILMPKAFITTLSPQSRIALLSGNQTVSVPLTHISSAPTDGTLYTATFTVPSSSAPLFTDGQYIPATVRLGNTAGTLVPLDAVYTTGDKNYVFTLIDNKAVQKTITVGQLQGSFIEVREGLGSGDVLILDKTVTDGEQVSTS